MLDHIVNRWQIGIWPQNALRSWNFFTRTLKRSFLQSFLLLFFSQVIQDSHWHLVVRPLEKFKKNFFLVLNLETTTFRLHFPTIHDPGNLGSRSYPMSFWNSVVKICRLLLSLYHSAQGFTFLGDRVWLV